MCLGIWVWVCAWAQVLVEARDISPLELELHVVAWDLMWVLGIELRNSAKALILNFWAHFFFFGGLLLNEFLRYCLEFRVLRSLKALKLRLNFLFQCWRVNPGPYMCPTFADCSLAPKSFVNCILYINTVSNVFCKCFLLDCVARRGGPFVCLGHPASLHQK